MRTVMFTTRADKALPLWQGNVDQIYFYKEDLPEQYEQFDKVYFRDPFNEPTVPISDEKIDQVIQGFLKDNPEIYSIDHIRGIEDLYVEDKYRQYQGFGPEFMSETWLASEKEFVPGEHVLKKRISCRCRDVYFAMPEGVELDLADYIVQKRDNICEELRVFYVNGEVCPQGETRSSKTETTKVKALGYRDLSTEEIDFVKRAMARVPEWDFAGVDLAILADGSMRIVEVNRSPQFMGYYNVTGINLAEKVF